jgi:hypothetical protein
MQQPGISWSGLIVLAGLLVGSPVVTALEIVPGVGTGLLYTDNARLSANDEENELIVVGYVGAKIDENSGAFRLNAEADLIHLEYTRDTFSDQDYPGLRLTGGYEQVRDRLDWQVQDYFTQTLVDSDDGATPFNIQNTNVFTFGPSIRFPISGRQTVTVNPQYRNFYYEDVGDNNQNDNQQYALSANWFYGMYPTMGVSLNGGVTKVVYDGGGGARDYIRSTALAGPSGKRARSVYSLNLGGTHINWDNSGSTSGFAGNLTWLYNLTGRSSARIYLSSDLTGTGNLLLDSQNNPDDGDFSNVQSSNDVVRNSILRLTYRREDATLNTELWGEFRDLDYQGGEGDQSDLDDREIREIGASMGYRVTAVLSTGIFGRYKWNKQTNTDRRDERYSITGTVGYQLTRRLRTNLDLVYQNQHSKGGLGDEYREFSTFVRLAYGFARVERRALRWRR